MLFRDRPDGVRVRHDTHMSAMLPYVMRSRSSATVYFSRNVDVEAALSYIHRMNAEQPGARYSLFGILLASAVRVFALKPRLNRFVSRRGVYQRNELCFSFIVKQSLTEEAPERSAKVWFEPEDTLSTVIAKTNQAIDSIRSIDQTPDEKEMSFVGSIPGMRAFSTFIFRLLDSWNIAPRGMIKSDPLYASAYFANLGSIGLETPYHHLYEWGTASLFVAMGTITRGGNGRRQVNIKISLDERIADGIYFAHAAGLMARFMRKPEELEMPLDDMKRGGILDTEPAGAE
ncbi:MAG TPA: hypothetical protein PK625_09625 [Spirochaetales bacterium]|nr:hypothetical protein [Spirochaetales bacterium]